MRFSRSSVCMVAGYVTAAMMAATASAQDCPSINFENLAVGTAVTNQYSGVTFSLVSTGCPAGTAFCRIITPTEGTSSGTRALGRDQSCPDFYTGVFRMVFDEDRSTVRFMLGEWGGGVYDIRAYNASGVQIGSTQSIGLTGSGLTPVYYPVTMSGPGIRRIDIDQSFEGQTVIDDLQFEIDTSPPVAEITSPTDGACFCSGGSITGSAHDPDGGITSWRLERRAFNAGMWTLISTSTTEVVSDQLSNWFPGSSATEGYYVLRLTVTNACGLVSTATRVTYLDRDFDDPIIRSPGAGGIVGGTVCIDGTAWDHCPSPTGVYTVDYAPLPAGTPFNPVNPAMPTYAQTVITDGLGSWNTLSGGAAVADGNYRVRVTGTDVCGFQSSQTVDVVVDNTPPIATLSLPAPCIDAPGMVTIRGTVNDAHLAGWSLWYSGGDVHTWQPLAQGAAPVIDGVLWTWNTAGLRPCAYVLRLIATDNARVNCLPSGNTTEYTVAVDVGCAGDFNRTGTVSVQDIFDFLVAYFAGCP